MFLDSNISLSQISYLLIIWSLTALTLELPSGLLADKYSRKTLIILGQIFNAIGYLIWLNQKNFPAFALGFAFWGMKSSLTSGTFEAFVFDKLKSIRQEQNYEYISGRINASRLIGTTFALIIGAILAERMGYNACLILSAVSSSLSLLPIISISESPIHKSTEEQSYFKYLWMMLKQTKNNKSLTFLLVLISLSLGVYGAFDEFLSLVLRDFDLSITFIGAFQAVIQIIVALSGILSFKLFTKKSNPEEKLISISAILLLLIGSVQTKYIAVLLIPMNFLLGITEVKIEAKIQQNILSHQRATLLSIKSFIVELLGIILTFVMGTLAENHGPRSIIILVGLMFIAGIFLSRQINRKQ